MADTSETNNVLMDNLAILEENAIDKSIAFEVGDLCNEEKRKTAISLKDGNILVGDEIFTKGVGNADIDKFRGEEWIFNATQNASTFSKCPSAGNLVNMYKDKGAACVIIGNGGSFHKNIDILRKLYLVKPPFIMASDRVFNKLKENGISPHLTMSVDGQERVADFFDPKHISKKDYFVPNVVTHKSVIDKLDKGNMFVGGMACALKEHPTQKGFYECESDTWNKIYGIAGTRFYSLTGSYIVGDMMLHLAGDMGFDVIISLGNDLSFSEDDKDEYSCKYRKFVIELEGKEYITTDPFLLGAFEFSKYPNLTMSKCVDCSNAPVHSWIKMEFSEICNFIFSDENAFNVYNYNWDLKKRYSVK